MTVKEQLYQLIEELPERDLVTAQRLLEDLRHSRPHNLLRLLLNAPEDDEPKLTRKGPQPKKPDRS